MAGCVLVSFGVAGGQFSFGVFLKPMTDEFGWSRGSLSLAFALTFMISGLLRPVAGYLAEAVARGMCLAIGLWLGMFLILGIGLAHPLYALAFAFLGSAMLGAIGIIAAIHAQKYDQMSAITNFIITPLAFLSGSFYSIEALPDPIRQLTLWNPIFYLIDGFRFAVIDVSDSAPAVGLAVCTLSTIALSVLAWAMFRVGYRLKS